MHIVNDIKPNDFIYISNEKSVNFNFFKVDKYLLLHLSIVKAI